MGLLDGLLGGISPQGGRPGFGNTLAAGAAVALLVKLMREHQVSQPPGSSSNTTSAAGGGLGGLIGALGGSSPSGGAGLAGLLSNLGGAGALGALINRFEQKGFGAQASSWVGNGPNAPIAPHEVGKVLGDDTLNELQARTGLTRDQLLQELARELPQAIDAATPQGRLPQDDELQQLAKTGSAQAPGNV